MAQVPLLKLDHITVVARTLEEGSAYIKEALGIAMPEGGAHPRMGTHNSLMALGPALFLELIAIDPAADAPERPRWFDLDRFDEEPRLATWVLATSDLKQTLTEAHPDSGRATEITRGDLTWLISVPENGTMPMSGGFPTLIEWPNETHPASRMMDLGCRLNALVIEHPDAREIDRLIGHRIDSDLIKIDESSEPKIKASIQTPSGERELS